MDIEHNFVEPRRTEIRNLLVSKGYIYKGENKWDDMYKHHSISASGEYNLKENIQIKKD